MCQAVARHLKPAGRFITINNNPDYSGQAEAMRKYDFTRAAKVDREGAPIVWKFFLEDGAFEITNYYLSVKTHQWALRVAGLRDIRWHSPRVSPEGVAAFGEDHWSDFLQTKPVVCIECVRPSESAAHAASQ